MIKYKCKVCGTEERVNFTKSHCRCTKCYKRYRSVITMALYRKSPEIRRRAHIIQKRYRDKNKEKCAWWYKARGLRNRIRNKELGYISAKTIKNVFEDNINKYGALACIYCLVPLTKETSQVEHKTPISRGGTNEFSNLGISCIKCNKEKYTKTEEEYRELLKEF